MNQIVVSLVFTAGSRRVDNVSFLMCVSLPCIIATLSEIRKAYKRLAKMYHPDKFEQDTPELKEKARQKFIELQEAYENLCSRK